MPRERRQGMDARSARAHGASSECGNPTKSGQTRSRALLVTFGAFSKVTRRRGGKVIRRHPRQWICPPSQRQPQQTHQPPTSKTKKPSRRLRLACTQIVTCGVWAIASEKQNQKPVLNKSQDVRRAFDSAEGVGARLPAICRAAVAKSGDSAVPDTPHAQVLLPVPGRSRASALLQGGVRQADARTKNARSVSSSPRCSCTR
jgi:hypothetical protein